MEAFWFINHIGILVNIILYTIVFIITLIPFLHIEVFEPSRCRPTAENVLEKIKNKMWWSSMFSYKIGGKKDPQGLVVGRWFISIITPQKVGNWRTEGIAFRIIIISLSSFSPKSQSQSQITDNKSTIEILASPTADVHAQWQRQQMNYYGRNNSLQNKIVNKIIKLANKSFLNNFPYGCVVLVSGQPGTGKSFISQILTKKLNGILCNTYNPTQYGHSIDEVYFNVGPTKDKPLIILIDEIDNKIQFKKENKVHEWLSKDVKDKSSWCNLMDKISCMNNLFVIMTTNLSFDELDDIDPSYFRKGRVHYRVEMRNVLTSKYQTIRFT